MKFPLISLLLICLNSAPNAFATSGSAVATVAESVRLITTTKKDLNFLNSNIDNCTSYGSQIRQRILNPLANDLQQFLVLLRDAYGQFSASPEAESTCQRPSANELNRGSEVARQIIATISAKLATAESAQSELLGLTGDQAMSRALSSDSSHLNCRPSNPSNPQSTRELQTYFALKQKLISIRARMSALNTETKTLTQNGGEGLCVAE